MVSRKCSRPGRVSRSSSWMACCPCKISRAPFTSKILRSPLLLLLTPSKRNLAAEVNGKVMNEVAMQQQT